MLLTSQASSPRDGVFVSKARIISVQDVSNQPNSYGKTYDLGIECILAVDGLEFSPKFTVFGNYKRKPHPDGVPNPQGEVMGWGSAYVVRDFFQTVLDEPFDHDSDQPSIPQEYLDKLLGKEFLRVSYRSGANPETGKSKYSSWNKVGKITESPDEVKMRFLKNYQESKYPRNYTPEITVEEAIASLSFP